MRLEHDYAPGQILAFFTTAPPTKNADGYTRYDHSTVKAVVATCHFRHTKFTVFATKWTAADVYDGRRRSRRLEVVDVSTLVRHCLMVPFDDTESEYHEIWSQDLWADAFAP